jgi:hypothetical protein
VPNTSNVRSRQELVEVPPQPFLRTIALENAPLIAAVNVMAGELPQGQIPILVNPPADQVGPGRSRYLMVIPPRLVGAILTASSAPEGLTPGDLWRNVAAPLWEDAVTRVSCAPFIEWCRIAYAHGGCGTKPAPPARAHQYGAPGLALAFRVWGASR